MLFKINRNINFDKEMRILMKMLTVKRNEKEERKYTSMCASHLVFQTNKQVLTSYMNSTQKIKHTVPRGVYAR